MRNSINPKSPFLQHSTKLRFLRQRMIILIRHLIYFSRVKSIKAMLWENRESKFNDWGDYLGFFFKYQKLTTQLNWIELNTCNCNCEEEGWGSSPRMSSSVLMSMDKSSPPPPPPKKSQSSSSTAEKPPRVQNSDPSSAINMIREKNRSYKP